MPIQVVSLCGSPGPQSAEAHDKSAYADNSGRRDRAAVHGARRTGTDTESDPVDDAQEEERRGRTGAEMAENEGGQAPNGVHDVADQSDERRPDQEAPEEPDRTPMVLRRGLCLGRSAHRRRPIKRPKNRLDRDG